MRLVADDSVDEPTFEQGSAPSVTRVECPGVCAVQHTHPTRDAALRLKHEVVVRVEETHGVETPRFALRYTQKPQCK